MTLGTLRLQFFWFWSFFMDSLITFLLHNSSFSFLPDFSNFSSWFLISQERRLFLFIFFLVNVRKITPIKRIWHFLIYEFEVWIFLLFLMGNFWPSYLVKISKMWRFSRILVQVGEFLYENFGHNQPQYAFIIFA